MSDLKVRDDLFEFVGTVVSAFPPVPSAVAPQSILNWTLTVKPELGQEAAITNVGGSTNPNGTVDCTVGVDQALVSWEELLPLFSAASGQKVRILGTLCDDSISGLAVILPMGVLAIARPLEIYDVDGWPTPVRDYDVLAFAHSSLDPTDPHAGESRTFVMRLPAPFRPSDEAILFQRAYHSTEINRVTSAVTAPMLLTDEVELTVVTGAPGDSLGFYSVQLGVTYDEPNLADYCPPGSCEHDSGKYCQFDDHYRYTRIPAHLPYAQTGDLAVSPGDGVGLVSGIVASLVPPQVYDHMGIFIDNGWSIRHCTSSQDRLKDDSLFTTTLSVRSLGIDLEDAKVPLNGLRPDLVRFGWPGAITQRVEEVYRNGRNSLNPRWTFAGTHPGQDKEDPDVPGTPFRIYQLPYGQRARRLGFNDPDPGRDKADSLIRLQEASVFIGDPVVEYKPMLVRPHPALDASVRPSLERVAQAAELIEAHYRLFAYTRGEIGRDPAFTVPGLADPFWNTVPAGSRWAAQTVPAMCASFVWTAVQLANLKPVGLPIRLEDRVQPEDPISGLEYGALDGFYRYHEIERLSAAKRLVGKLTQMIYDQFDSKITKAEYITWPQLIAYRAATAQNVANQTANAFAFDRCEDLSSGWTSPGGGETASPDDVLKFWDLQPSEGDEHPDGMLFVYGDSVPILLAPPSWSHVPLFRRTDHDPGRGNVTARALINGQVTSGVTVRFDFGCQSAMTSDDPEQGFRVKLEAGRHFADGFILLPNPVTGQLETFRSAKPLEFGVTAGSVTHIDLVLEPPSDLWRVIDVHLDADIHDKSIWGGDADAHHFIIDEWGFELRQDLEDDPDAPDDQRNTVLHHEQVNRTEPEVGSGVHVAVSIVARLDPTDRAVKCHCEVALIDTDSGGFLGLGTSSDVDQIEKRDFSVPADGFFDVLVGVNFSSQETVPERAQVSLRMANRRRPS